MHISISVVDKQNEPQEKISHSSFIYNFTIYKLVNEKA